MERVAQDKVILLKSRLSKADRYRKTGSATRGARSERISRSDSKGMLWKSINDAMSAHLESLIFFGPGVFLMAKKAAFGFGVDTLVILVHTLGLPFYVQHKVGPMN